ncbi:restriction endonuclease subunit S [Tritonibacter mobilis]|uniref:restriction endonuclease subunit S n=1 Tax=Tritonibacter mobilis TaxID=379347 RepID=UPI0039A4E848
MSELPSTWTEAKIGELCDLINGRAFKPSDWVEVGLPIVRIQNLNNTDKPFNRFNGEVRERFLIDNGDLLFAWSGTPGTSFGAHVWTGGRAVLNQHIFKVNFDRQHLDQVFFRHAINQKLNELIDKAQGGVGLRHVTKGAFQETKISLPPLAEQKRIVRKLETLSARTATARTNLTAITKLVERYRNAVLDLAFKGALTAEWRALHRVGPSASTKLKRNLEELRVALVEKGDKPPRVRTAKANNHRIPVQLPIPSDWALSTMEEISSPVRLIQYGILKPGPEEAGGVPYVKVMNIKGGVVEPEKIRHTTKEIHRQYMRSSLKTGDLLLTIRGTVGRMAFVPESLDGGNITQDTVRIDVLGGMNSAFVYWFFHSPQAQTYFRENLKGVAVRGINVGDVRPMEVPLPSRTEQDEIVRRIQTYFAKIDLLAAEATKALKLTDRMDQSLLAKAFSGELVLQDPNDEPANELLNRIRDARADAPKPKRQTRKPRTMKRKTNLASLLDDWPPSGMTFEELRGRATGTYAQLKEELFELMLGDKPKICQEFDRAEQTMRLKKVNT